MCKTVVHISQIRKCLIMNNQENDSKQINTANLKHPCRFRNICVQDANIEISSTDKYMEKKKTLTVPQYKKT